MSEFTFSTSGEPHARRRKVLLAQTPEIRTLYGYDRRTAWVTGAVVIAQFVLAAGVSWQFRVAGPLAQWWLLLLGAYVIGGTLTHWLSMAIHETSHRSAARTARGNDAVALLANLPMILPLAITFNRYHLDHHRQLGVLGGDTDLPLDFEVRWIGNSTWRKALWLALHPVVYLVRGATFAKPPNRGELLNGVLIIGVNVVIWNTLGPMAFLYLGLSFFFAHGLHPAAGHFIHEHYSFTPGQETTSYYGPLNWVTFNVGYHNEHHDFMNIPGWRLPALAKMVPDYRELETDTSWTKVFWKFITDPALGYGSRIVRTRRDFDRGRLELANGEYAHAKR